MFVHQVLNSGDYIYKHLTLLSTKTILSLINVYENAKICRLNALIWMGEK